MKVKPADANGILREQGEDALRNAFDNGPRWKPTPHRTNRRRDKETKPNPPSSPRGSLSCTSSDR